MILGNEGSPLPAGPMYDCSEAEMHYYLLPALLLAAVGLGILVAAVVTATRPGRRSGVTPGRGARGDDAESSRGSSAR